MISHVIAVAIQSEFAKNGVLLAAAVLLRSQRAVLGTESHSRQPLRAARHTLTPLLSWRTLSLIRPAWGYTRSPEGVRTTHRGAHGER